MTGKQMIDVSPWAVIAGAPCSGKTTLLNRLEAMGYKTCPDIARLVIREEIARGLKPDQLKPQDISVKIWSRMLEAENAIPTDMSCIFDHALPGSIAFRRQRGLDLSDIDMNFLRRRYRLVFIFDPLPFEADGERNTTDYFSQTVIRDELEVAYKELDYPVVNIPVCGLEERLDIVLKHLENCGILSSTR